MSLSVGGGRGFIGRIANIFRRSPRDPISKKIYEAISVIDRMITSIDITKRSLTQASEEHSRRAKQFADEGRKQYEEIFLQELEHIGGILSILEKSRVDLIRIKTRLSTIASMERPLRELPEVIEELRVLRPQVEKIMPQLTLMMTEVERKVQDIIATTNVPNLPSIPYTSTTSYAGKPVVESSRTGKLPPLPPKTTPSKLVNSSSIATPTVSVNLVKKWLIHEIKSSGGVLDIGSFTRKYNVSKSIVFHALRQLEKEGKIRLAR